MSKNQRISKSDLAFIRQLKDFDLIMLLSEVHDHGWQVAKRTLEFMKEANKAIEQTQASDEA